jgi:1,4-alpha-glucan branching enzyme
MHPSNQLSHPPDNMFSTEPLGAIYTPEQTTFRVWAPTAGRVMLKLYDSPSSLYP